MKRANFIGRNNSMIQEFSFAHPDTLLQVNQIYNSDYSGNCVWDLFCRDQEKLENSYSTALRRILDSRQEKLCIPGFNSDERDDMLSWICNTGPS